MKGSTMQKQFSFSNAGTSLHHGYPGTSKPVPSMEPGRRRISFEAWCTPERKNQIDKKKGRTPAAKAE